MPVGKLLVTCPTMDGEEFLARVREVVGTRGIVAFSGVDGLAEVSAPGVTKAAALARWCDELGIAAVEVWAFGDMPNDLPMLTWAGVSFAVANAHPDVLAGRRTVPGQRRGRRGPGPRTGAGPAAALRRRKGSGLRVGRDPAGASTPGRRRPSCPAGLHLALGDVISLGLGMAVVPPVMAYSSSGERTRRFRP